MTVLFTLQWKKIGQVSDPGGDFHEKEKKNSEYWTKYFPFEFFFDGN